jgi:hypothetical protein
VPAASHVIGPQVPETNFTGFSVQVSAPPLAAQAASLIRNETFKRRIPDNEHRVSKEGILSILKKIGHRATQAPARRERNYPSTFCGSLLSFLAFHTKTLNPFCRHPKPDTSFYLIYLSD